MLKVIDKVSLYDDKRFACNVFLKLLDKVTYPIELYETNNAVSFRSDVLPSGRRLDLWEIKRPGVYIIYYNNEIIYIGQSERNMHTRIVRFLKAFLDCQAFTERHPGGEKFREYMKRSYDSIPETEKPMSRRHTAAVAYRDEYGSLENIKYSGMAKLIDEKLCFDEWLWSQFVWHDQISRQPLAISICPIDEHFYAINNEGEHAHLTESERPYLDEFLAGAMKRIPKFNSKVQELFDNQLFDDPSGITNDQIAEKLENILHQRGLVPRPRHNNSNLENLVMEKNDMTTIFEDLTEQDHAWLDGLSNRATSGFRNKVLDQVLSLNVGKGFKFPTTSKSGFTQGSWVRKKVLESNPNIALTFKKKENYCYVKRTA